jgi:hypothetical protein
MLEEAAVSRRNLAELELQQGHLDSAIEQANKAEILFREREDWRGLADAGLLRVQALLAAHAEADARKGLAELAKPIAQASTEQRGIAALLQAEFADRAKDRATSIKASAQARQLAGASGVKQLQLQVALRDPQSHRDLDRDTATLGNVPLRLQWLAIATRRALEHNQTAAAVTTYREALSLLRHGDTLTAVELHALGTRAYAAGGDAVRATEADEAMRTALQQLQSHVPQNLRANFVAAQSAKGK